MDEQRAWIRARRKKRLRLLAAALAFCLLFTTYPDILETLSVFAEGTQEGDDMIYVSRFMSLPEEVREQTVPVGTQIEELSLPDTLEAVVVTAQGSTPPEGTEQSGDTKKEPSENAGEGTDDSPENAGEGTDDSPENAGEGTDAPSENAGEGTDDSPEDAGEGTDDSPEDAGEETEGLPEDAGEGTQDPEGAGPEDTDIRQEESADGEDSDAHETDGVPEEDDDTGSEDTAMTHRTHTVTLPRYGAQNAVTAQILEDTRDAGTREETAVIEGVTWRCEPAYDGDTEGTYKFSATLPEGYAPAEGVSMPEIKVTVQGEEDWFPETPEELERYLQNLDPESEEAKRVESMEAYNIRTYEGNVSEARAAGEDGFAQRHKVRVVWNNEKPIKSCASKANCQKTYFCLRVPSGSGAETMKFYFNKDILRDGSGKDVVMGEFTLPNGYEDGGDLFPTRLGMYSAISLIAGRPGGTVKLQVYDYVKQEYVTYYSLSLLSGGAVLGSVLSKEEWLDIDKQPTIRLGYGYAEGDTGLSLDTDRDVTKRFGVSFADNYGVALPRTSGDWEIGWSLKTETGQSFPGDKYDVHITQQAMDGFTLTAGPAANAMSGDGVSLNARAQGTYRGRQAGNFTLAVSTDGSAGCYIQYAGADGAYIHKDLKAYGSDYRIKDLREVLEEGDPLGELFDGTYTGTDGKTYQTGDVYRGNASLGLFPGFKPRPYKVTLDARHDQKGEYSQALAGNAQQTVEMIFGEKYKGSVPVPQYAPEGYVFWGYWDEGMTRCYIDRSGQPYDPYDIQGDATLYAKWRQEWVGYRLDVNAEAGAEAGLLRNGFTTNFTDGNPTLKDHGLSLPSSPEEVWYKGHELIGWFTEREGGTQITDETPLPVEESLYTFYAHWKPASYTMTYDPNGGSFDAGTVTRVQVTYGEPYGTAVSAAPEPVREDCEFMGYGTYKGAKTALKPEDLVYSAEDITVYALWSAGVTLHLDPDGGTLPAGQVPYVQGRGGQAASLPVPVRTGYTFVCWEGEGERSVRAEGGVHAYTVPLSAEGGVTLRAVWEINTYDVTFSANGGTGAQMTALKLTYGQSASLPACTYTRPGYTFGGWDTRADGTGVTYADGAAVKDLTDEPDGTVPLYAAWKPDRYTVSFDAAGGVLAAGKDKKDVTYGEAYGELPEPDRGDRYDFLGWYTEREGGSRVTAASEVSVAAGHTLYARWQYRYYTLTFDLRGGSGSGGENFAPREMLKEGQELPSQEPVRDGWDFAGYSTTAGGTVRYQAGGTASCDREAMTLYAVWTSDEPYVTYDPNCEDAAVKDMPAEQLIDVEAGSVTLSSRSPARTGWTFKGWALAADGVACCQPGAAVRAVRSFTLYAVWEQTTEAAETVKLTLKDGTETLSEALHPKGAQAVLPERPAPAGKGFSGWSRSDGGSAAYAAGYALTLTQDTTLYAVYKEGECKYRVSADDAWAYGTLEEADAALRSGGDVVMLKDKSQDVLIELTGSYTLDLNGKTLTGLYVKGDTMTICNGTLEKAEYRNDTDQYMCLYMDNFTTTDVTVRDVTINCDVSKDMFGNCIRAYNGRLTLTGNTLLRQTGSGSRSAISCGAGLQMTIEYAELYSNVIKCIQGLALGNQFKVVIKDGFFYCDGSGDIIHGEGLTLEFQGGYFAAKTGGLVDEADGKKIGGEGTAYLINTKYSFGLSSHSLPGEEAAGVSPINDLGNDGPWYKISSLSAQTRHIWSVNGARRTEMAPSYTQDGNNTFTLIDDHACADTDVTWDASGRRAAVDLSGHTYVVKGGLAMNSGTAENGSIGNGILKVSGTASFSKTDIRQDLVVKADSVTLSADDTMEAGARFYTNSTIAQTSFGDIVLLKQAASDDADYAHYYIATPWEASGITTAPVTCHSNYPAGSGKADTTKTVNQTRGGKWSVPTAFTAPTGFVFYEWNTEADGSGRRVTADTLYDSAVTDIYAVWQRKNVTVTFNVNGGTWAGGGNTAVTRTVPYNHEVGTAPAVRRDGYVLAGWYTTSASAGGTQFSSAGKAVANQTYYARWKAAAGTGYTVVYTCGATTLDEREFYGTTGATIALGTIKKDFDGYTYSSKSGNTTIKADGTSRVTLNYTRNSHTVSVAALQETAGGQTPFADAPVTIAGGSGSAGTSGNTTAENCSYGTAVTLTAGPVTGYEFAGWSGDYTGRKDTLTFAMPDRDVAVTACYRKIVYTAAYDLDHITARAQGGTADVPTEIEHGETLAVSLTAQEGYTLPGGITVTMAGRTLTAGTDYTYTIEEDGKTASIEVQNVTGAVVISAAGVPKTYTVRFEEKPLGTQGAEDGLIRASMQGRVLPGNVSHGTSCSVTLTPQTGYELPETIEVVTDADEHGNGGSTLQTGSYHYNPLNGAVYFPAVTGDILIRAGAVPGKDTLYRAEFYRMGTDGTYGETPYETAYLTGETGTAIDVAALARGKNYTGFTYEKYTWETADKTDAVIAADGSTVVRFYYGRNRYTVAVKVPDGEGGYTDWNGNDGAEGAEYTYYYRESVSLALPVPTGYRMTGWKAYDKDGWEQDGGAGVQTLYAGMDDKLALSMPARNLVVTPLYSPKSLRVSGAGLTHISFDTTNGDPEAWYEQPFEAIIKADIGYSLPEDIKITIGADEGAGMTLGKEDYTYDPDTGEIQITASKKVTGTIEIIAQGVRKVHKVTVRFADGVTAENANLHLSREPGDYQADHGGRFAMVLTPVSGYELSDTIPVTSADDGAALTEGVSYDQETGSLIIGNIREDILITLPAAKEGEPAPVPYTVEHYRADGRGGYKLAATAYREEVPGTAVTAAQRDGMRKNYTGYTYNREASGGDTAVTVAADGSTVIRLYYDYASYELTVSIESGIQGGVSGEGLLNGSSSASYRYHYGDSIDVQITGVEGGTSFAGWYVGGGMVTPGKNYTFTMPAQDMTLAAKSREGSYELVAFGSHGKATIPDEEEEGYLPDIPYETQKTVTILPEEHYHLPEDVDVTVDGEKAAQGYYTYTLTQDGTEAGQIDLRILGDTAVEFKMEPDTYEITLDPAGGTLEQEKLQAVYGEPYGALPIPERSGYTFLGWFSGPDEGIQIEPGTGLLENGDHTLYARWEKKTDKKTNRVETPENADYPGNGPDEDTEPGNGSEPTISVIPAEPKEDITSQTDTTPEDTGRAVMDGEEVVTLTEDDEAVREGTKSGGSASYSLGTGKITVEVNCPQTSLQASVPDTAAVINAVLSAEHKQMAQKGSRIRIRIDVTDTDGTTTQEDRTAMEEALTQLDSEEGLAIAMYTDISMFLQIDDGEWQKITMTADPIDIVIDIPEKLAGLSGELYMLREHEGTYTLLTDQDDVPQTVTISTDRFCPYAFVYRQTQTDTGAKGKCSLCHICPTFLGICYFIWLAIIIAMIILVIIILKRKRDEEEQEGEKKEGRKKEGEKKEGRKKEGRKKEGEKERGREERRQEERRQEERRQEERRREERRREERRQEERRRERKQEERLRRKR